MRKGRLRMVMGWWWSGKRWERGRWWWCFGRSGQRAARAQLVLAYLPHTFLVTLINNTIVRVIIIIIIFCIIIIHGQTQISSTRTYVTHSHSPIRMILTYHICHSLSYGDCRDKKWSDQTRRTIRYLVTRSLSSSGGDQSDDDNHIKQGRLADILSQSTCHSLSCSDGGKNDYDDQMKKGR